MKGLLIKDALSIVKQNEIFIIMLLLINAVFMTFLDDLSFLSVITMFFTAVLVLKQMADEDKNGYGDYQKTLPVSPRDIVLSRYIFGFGFAVVGAAASLVTELFFSFLFDFPLDFVARVKTTLLFAGVAFILLCILLPIIYKVGTKPVGILNVLLLLIPTAVNFFFGDALPSLGSGNIGIAVIVIAVAAAVAIVAASILLSLKIVKNK